MIESKEEFFRKIREIKNKNSLFHINVDFLVNLIKKLTHDDMSKINPSDFNNCSESITRIFELSKDNLGEIIKIMDENKSSQTQKEIVDAFKGSIDILSAKITKNIISEMCIKSHDCDDLHKLILKLSGIDKDEFLANSSLKSDEYKNVNEDVNLLTSLIDKKENIDIDNKLN